MGGEHVIAIVAIISVFSVFGLVWFMGIRAQMRARELLHAERQAAIEKGLTPPDEPLAPEAPQVPGNGGSRKAPAHVLKMGIVWLFLGFGIILAMRIADPGRTRWAWGIIVVAMGLADLVYWLVSGKTEAEASHRDVDDE
jgi:hypothetical protein